MRLTITLSRSGETTPTAGLSAAGLHRRIVLTVTADREGEDVMNGGSQDRGGTRKSSCRNFRAYFATFLKHSIYRDFL
jgi:hypothetical protein